MFKARIKPSERDTAERRYEFHLGEAIRAALAGDNEKAAGHSGTALSISRELYAATREPARYRPGLAAALVTNARYQRAHRPSRCSPSQPGTTRRSRRATREPT